MPIIFPAVPTSDVAGIYAAMSDIEDVFGTVNVARWSQLDNTVTTADTSRILRYLLDADERIDDYFRDSVYAAAGASSPVMPLNSVTNYWAAVMAGVGLYNARGQAQEGEGGSMYDKMLADVAREMGMYRAGLRYFGSGRQANQPTGPVDVGA